MMHVAEEMVNIYERLEPYEACGQELREAYVEMKHHREMPLQTEEDARRAFSARDAQDEQDPPQTTESEEQQRLGEQTLNALEQSVSGPDFVDKLRAAQGAHRDAGGRSTAELDELMGEYVIVTKQDAIDAMASFLAATLASMPEAQNMDPRKLQAALLCGIKDVKTSKLKEVWRWGRYLYRGSAFAYSAFTVYGNPWLIRAIVTSLWTTTQVLIQVLR